MPLSATAPTNVTPEILRNMQYAQEYVEHVALIRELLDQASLPSNPNLLERSNNQLLQSLGGLLGNLFPYGISSGWFELTLMQT